MNVHQLVVGVALTGVMGGCGGDEPRYTSDEGECDACPACAASMVCFEGATLICKGVPEQPYSPIACARPDGTKHGQYKDFEYVDDHWIETDGWYVDGVPVGYWVSVDATGKVVKVISYLGGQSVEMQI
jgi:hypothetical protein